MSGYVGTDHMEPYFSHYINLFRYDIKSNRILLFRNRVSIVILNTDKIRTILHSKT